MIELDNEIWMDLEDEDEGWLDLGDHFDETLTDGFACRDWHYGYLSLCGAPN